MRLASKVAIITGASNGMGAAEARLFASDEASYITGTELPVDGGLTAR